ncbi:hypothetical protein, variant, partial [Sphaeroforma arctica JP610]
LGGPEDLCMDGGHIFIFKSGCIVAWNIKKKELNKVADILGEVSIEEYPAKVEDFINQHTRVRGANVIFNVDAGTETHELERFAVSDALALSVKLDVWEDDGDAIIQSMQNIPMEMKQGLGMNAGTKFMMQKTGELQLLRYNINLSSSLKSIPDFYWDRPELEKLYLRMCEVSLDVKERTSIINEKLGYSNDLANVLRAYIDQYHMAYTESSIVALIVVCIVFETSHWFDRFGMIPGLTAH